MTPQLLLRSILQAISRPFDPAAKLKELMANPLTPKASLPAASRSVNAKSVIAWHELSKPALFTLMAPSDQPGTLRGWKRVPGHGHDNSTIRCPALAEIVKVDIEPDWSCDILDVHGFSESKAPLDEFMSTDDLIRARYPELISDISADGLRKNLAHDQIRVIHRPGSDHFERATWDGRLFLVNEGGSHHFSAAKFIAARIGEPVPLRARLRTLSLNESAVDAVREEFEVLVTPSEPSFQNQLFDSLKVAGATWYVHDMPEQLSQVRALFLPKADARSRLVARVMLEAGAPNLGAHLKGLSRVNLTKPEQAVLHPKPIPL